MRQVAWWTILEEGMYGFILSAALSSDLVYSQKLSAFNLSQLCCKLIGKDPKCTKENHPFNLSYSLKLLQNSDWKIYYLLRFSSVWGTIHVEFWSEGSLLLWRIFHRKYPQMWSWTKIIPETKWKSVVKFKE